jgi:hypothetical protein
VGGYLEDSLKARFSNEEVNLGINDVWAQCFVNSSVEGRAMREDNAAGRCCNTTWRSPVSERTTGGRMKARGGGEWTRPGKGAVKRSCKKERTAKQNS